MPDKKIKNMNVRTVILAGSRDFGRCPIATRLPPALWPVGEKNTLLRLLEHLSSFGIEQAVVCAGRNTSLIREAAEGFNSIQLEFLEENLPLGTAGCIRDAIRCKGDFMILVIPANIINPPDFDILLEEHQECKSDLTVVLNPSDYNKSSGIYICQPEILDYIPSAGYYDIKESLIPELLRARKNIHTVTLKSDIGNFRDSKEYLYSITNCIKNDGENFLDMSFLEHPETKNIQMTGNVKIDDSARICGAVLTGKDISIGKNCVVFGPSIIGNDVTIGENTLVADSILWEGAEIGNNCEIKGSLLDYDVVVPEGQIVKNKALSYETRTIFECITSLTANIIKQFRDVLYIPLARVVKTAESAIDEKLRRDILFASAVIIMILACAWLYWPAISDLWNVWQKSDEYSSGLLVPILAAHILWLKRNKIADSTIKPSIWGLLGFIAAQSLLYFGLIFMYPSAERLSIVLGVASLTLFIFGWQVFRKVLAVFIFLLLMFPLPRPLHISIAMPLQDIATSSAVFCLELLGYAVIREGNYIHINNTTVAVLEACNGLRMITAFFVIIGWVVLMVRRPWWEKLILLLSGLPIAILCNTIRLTITAIIFTNTSLAGPKWEKIFHDFGGYAMMPLALVLVVFELWILSRLIIQPDVVEPQVLFRKHSS